MQPNEISTLYANRVANALASVDRVPTDMREKQGVTEQWSVKDLLGHCAYWDGVHVAELESEFAGGTIEEDVRADDVINAEQFQVRASRSWDQIMEEVTTNRDKLVELLKRPSRNDQSESGDHWVEHGRQIEDWLRGKDPHPAGQSE